MEINRLGGFRVESIGFRVKKAGLRVKSLRFAVEGSWDAECGV